MNKQATSRAGRSIAAALLLVGIGAGAARPAAATVKIKQPLAPTTVDPAARGKLKFVMRSASAGKLVVTAGRAGATQNFDVVVNGIKVGTMSTDVFGSGRLNFRTTPQPGDQTLGFDPRGSHVLLRNSTGQDVLVGDMPEDTTDPNALACCIPDDGGSQECEELTADACTAAGGTPGTVNSCLPDPCATATPPPTQQVCCTNATHDDESEAECEELAQADCAAAGGTVVDATSCDADPCAATPPANQTACCLPNGGETECEVLTAEACTALQGTPADGTTCDNDPCNSGANGDSGSGDSADSGSGDSGGSGGSDN
jgi:hypothetical protein